MVMNFDNYSTSFQSLMSPMYNVQASYSGIYGGGTGMGGYCGMGIYPGYMGMGMGGFMTPMNGVGIGQFNADYLIKNDDKNNNYYARPIAAHKKHDEVPTMLGILGTALGTAALLLALRKGKKPTRPVNTNPVNTPPVNPTNPAQGAQTSRIAGYLPAPTHKPVNPVNTNPVNPTNPAQSAQTSRVAGYLPAPTHKPVNPVNTNPVNPTNPAQSAQTTHIAGYLPAKTARQAEALAKQQAAMNLPSSGNVFTTPAAQTQVAGYLPASGQQNLPVKVESPKVNLGPVENYLPKEQQTFNIPHQGVKGYLPGAKQNVKGLLPQYTSKQAEALAKQQAAMNLPSSGNVYKMPSVQLQKTNNNLSNIRPDLMKNGEVVYTTHTPQTLSEGYSIGSNAKGADKLQALLAQMK